MNYYPNNFYGNYSYGSSYPQVSPSASAAANFLGKLVDGEEVVKATEVPFGGYGVFPKADLSEIYIKSWNADGTTKILRFQPIEQQDEPKEDFNAILLNKITEIETKLDKLTQTKPVNQVPTTIEKRKELNVSAY